MFYLLVQTGFWVLLAFLLGSFIGWRLRGHVVGQAMDEMADELNMAQAQQAAAVDDEELEALEKAVHEAEKKQRAAEHAQAEAEAAQQAAEQELARVQSTLQEAETEVETVKQKFRESIQVRESDLLALRQQLQHTEEALALCQGQHSQSATQPEATEQPVAVVHAADDLKKIKGIGPHLEGKLAEQGITTYRQIATLTPADIERIGAHIGRFAGRIEREDWLGQARDRHAQKYGEDV